MASAPLCSPPVQPQNMFSICAATCAHGTSLLKASWRQQDLLGVWLTR